MTYRVKTKEHLELNLFGEGEQSVKGFMTI